MENNKNTDTSSKSRKRSATHSPKGGITWQEHDKKLNAKQKLEWQNGIGGGPYLGQCTWDKNTGELIASLEDKSAVKPDATLEALLARANSESSNISAEPAEKKAKTEHLDAPHKLQGASSKPAKEANEPLRLRAAVYITISERYN